MLETVPVDAKGDKTTAKVILDHVDGRTPVIAAGQIKTPRQAEEALELGLSLVAVGQGLVINPDWVELAEEGRDDQIQIALNPARVSQIAIPTKLWGVIEATTGWFTLQSAQ